MQAFHGIWMLMEREMAKPQKLYWGPGKISYNKVKNGKMPVTKNSMFL